MIYKISISKFKFIKYYIYKATLRSHFRKLPEINLLIK